MSDIFGKISIDPKTPQNKTVEKKSPPKHQRSSKKSTSHKPLSKKLIWLSIFILVLCLYSFAGFFIVPYYLTHSIPQQLKLRHNLTLSSDKVSFNPFTFRLKTENLSITQENGDPLVTIDLLDAIVAPLEVLRMEFVFPKISLKTPAVYLTRYKNNSYNVSPLLVGLDPDAQSRQVMSFSELPFLFSLNNIIISDGSVLFVDNPANKIHKIEKINVQLPTLSNVDYRPDTYIAPYFSAIVNGSLVKFKDDGTKPEDTMTMTWEFNGLKLEEYVDYLPFNLPFTRSSGTADGTITIHFNDEVPPDRFAIGFNLNITNFNCSTSETLVDLESQSVFIDGLFNPVNNLLTVSKLQINSPNIALKTNHFRHDIKKLFKPQKKKTLQATVSDRKVNYSLQFFEITKGTLTRYFPEDTEEIDEWKDLSLNITGYNSDKNTINSSGKSLFKIAGARKDGSNSFTYTGSFTTPKSINGNISIDNLDTHQLLHSLISAYPSASYSGTSSLTGNLSYFLNNDTHAIDYNFDKMKTSIANLSITYKDQTIVKAKELVLTNATMSDVQSSLGNVSMKKGTLFIDRSAKDNFFSKLLNSDNVIDTLDFHGDIIVDSPKNRSQFTVQDSTVSYGKKGLKQHPDKNISIASNNSSGSYIKGIGTVSFNPFAISLTTHFKGIKTSEVKALFSTTDFFNTTDGKISGKGSLNLPVSGFIGNVSISSGKITNNQSPLMWKNCTIENLNYTSTPYHLGIGRIKLTSPFTKIDIDKNSNSISDHFLRYFNHVIAPKTSDNIQQKKVHISQTDIQELAIIDGQFNIVDNRLEPSWKAHINNVKGSIKDIHLAQSADKSTFHFTGNIDNSPFTWSGDIGSFKDDRVDRYQLSITNYPISNLGSQINTSLDLDTKNSTISLDLISDWTSDTPQLKINGQLSNLKPSNTLSDTALPVAMMTDKDGKVQIAISTLPHAGNNLSLFETVTKNFQTRIVKGNLSPLLLAQGDFADLIDNDYIHFRPGLFILSNSGKKTLARYSALLINHPNIKLSLSGGIFLPQDTSSLHVQLEKIEQSRVEKQNKKLQAKWLKKKQEFDQKIKRTQDSALSKGVISEDNIPTKVLSGFRPILPEPVVVDNEMLLELAEKRLKIVRDQIVSQLSLDESRVEITPQKIDNLIGNKESRGVHVGIHPREIQK